MVDVELDRGWLCGECWSDVAEHDRCCAECSGHRPEQGWPQLPWRHKGRYLLLERTARGGMGAVFVARDEHSGQRVAVKLAQVRRGERMRAAFEHEMELAGFLSRSPHFVTVIGWDGTVPPDLIMEYVDWPTLAQVFEQRFPLSPDEVARLGIGICRGLEVLAAHNLVHRDLKPENIFVQDGPRSWHVKLADLGAWQPATDPEQSSRVEEDVRGVPFLVGTPAYMSPEQMYDGPLTKTSDVHSLGSILWEAATSRVPFPLDGAFDAVHIRQRYRACEVIPDRPRGMPPPLYDALARALDIDPERRPSPRRLRLALERFVDGDLAAPPRGALNAEQDTTRRDPAITDPFDVLGDATGTTTRRESAVTTLERPEDPPDEGTGTFQLQRSRWPLRLAVVTGLAGPVLAWAVLHTVPLTVDIDPWATEVLLGKDLLGAGDRLEVPIHHRIGPTMLEVRHPNFVTARIPLTVPWLSGVQQQVTLTRSEPLVWEPGPSEPQARVEGQQEAFLPFRVGMDACLGPQQLVAGAVEVRVDATGVARGVELLGEAGEAPERARCLERVAAATVVPAPPHGSWTRLLHDLAGHVRYVEPAPGGIEMLRVAQGQLRRSGQPRSVAVLSQPFFLSAQEVTRAQWVEVMGSPPEGCTWPEAPPAAPATCVKWEEAVSFANRLSAIEGLQPAYRTAEDGTLSWVVRSGGYRLPTEAEWEYAARAGLDVRFAGSDDAPCTVANLWDRSAADDAGIACEDGAVGLAEVGSYLPNDWGLYDMTGNASEWVWDRYGRLGSGMLRDPAGPEVGDKRVVRGADYDDLVAEPLGVDRSGLAPDSARPDLGFRLAR